MFAWLKRLFTRKPRHQVRLAEAFGEYTIEEIEAIAIMMGSDEDPGPLRSLIIKFANRCVEQQIGLIRSCIAGQDWSRAALHEGRTQAFQELVFELENVASMQKVHRTSE